MCGIYNERKHRGIYNERKHRQLRDIPYNFLCYNIHLQDYCNLFPKTWTNSSVQSNQEAYMIFSGCCVQQLLQSTKTIR